MSLLKKGGYTTYVSSRTENESQLVEIQNVPSSRVYIFGDDGPDEVGMEDSTLEMTELRPRSKKKRSYASTKSAIQQYNKKTETILRDILPNDSLQSFSLQYGCTVAELKRANYLYSDQDFHALKTIKIPVQPHGLLTETGVKKQRPSPLKMPGNLPSTSTDIDNDDDDKSDYEDGEPNGDCVRTISIRSALDSPNSFLQHMDNDLKLICKSTPLRKHNLDEVARTLTVNCINPLKLKKQQEKTLGTACGIGWKGIIVTVFVVGILLPGIVAFLYLRKKGS